MATTLTTTMRTLTTTSTRMMASTSSSSSRAARARVPSWRRAAVQTTTVERRWEQRGRRATATSITYDDALAPEDAGGYDDEEGSAEEYAEERVPFATFLAREMLEWLKAQPGNLRKVAPLLSWPNKGILTWDTAKGVAVNSFVVMSGMAALTLLLGGTDAALSWAHRAASLKFRGT